MSSKVDSLLKKATTFERLALYGDRKSFLQALAQQATTDPAPWRIYDEPNDPRGQERNWTPQVENGQRKYVYMGPAIPPGGVPHTPSFWDKHFRPREYPEQPNVITPLSDDQTPPVDRDPNLMFQKQLNAPAVPEREAPGPAASPVGYDAGIESVQIFLNDAFRPQITAGQMGPIVQDGKLGPETSGRLQQWASTNGLKGQSLQNLVDIAKAKAAGSQVIKSLQPGPNAT